MGKRMVLGGSLVTLLREVLTCLICRINGTSAIIDLDHILPRSTHPQLRDGHPENLAPLCRPCHQAKTEKRIETWVDEPRGGGLWYGWRRLGIVIGSDNASGNREVAVDKRYGCLRPVEDIGVSDALSSDVGSGFDSGLVDGDKDDSVRGRAGSVRDGYDLALRVDGDDNRSLVEERNDEASSRVGGDKSSVGVLGDNTEQPDGDSGKHDSVDVQRAGGTDLSTSPTSYVTGLEDDWAHYSEQRLLEEFDSATDQIRDGLLRKCKAVYVYRNRVGKGWQDGASQLFTVSRRTAEGFAGMWSAAVAFQQHDAIAAAHIGELAESRSLVQMIGRMAPERAVDALGEAVGYVAEFGEPPTAAALAYRLKGDVEVLTPETCVTCGQILRRSTVVQ